MSIRFLFTAAIAALCLLPSAVGVDVNAQRRKAKDAKTVEVTDLRTEHLVEPMEIGTTAPRLGWRLLSARQDVRQTSYRIIVSSSAEKAEQLEGDLWDATVSSAENQWVPYAGSPLQSNTRCYWRVNVQTNQGETGWSKTASWNVALLEEADWAGTWIGLDKVSAWDREDVHSLLSSRYLRSEFQLDDKNIVRATLYICGLGLYEAYVNGQNIKSLGSDKPRALQPAPSDYRRTALYNAYDVTRLLAQGADNAIGVVLGNGRFYTMQQNKKAYKITNFGYPKMRANIIVEYADGTRKTIASNNKWRLTTDGAIRSSNEYDGEVFDARKALPDGWTRPGFDDTAWLRAERVAPPYGTLRPQQMPGMKVLANVNALSVKPLASKNGKSFIVDFGENMAGWAALKNISAPAGDTVFIRYAELLNADGSLKRDNLRHALSTDKYVSDGSAVQSYCPTFVYHGFRYVEVEGLTDLNINDICAQKVSDEMEQTGSFRSSNAVVNAVYDNAVRGIAANYKGMPVDCPQRDERQPWLGDRTMGSTGEAFIFDNHALYAKWMRDIEEAQREDGCIPDVAPAFWNYYSDIVTWPAAMPFTLRMLGCHFGDWQVMERHYASVDRWLRHMKKRYGKDGLITRDKYGDWCVPPEKPELIHSQDPARQTDGTLISSAYYVVICRQMAVYARANGRTADAAYYASEAAATAKAFVQKFLSIKMNTSAVPGHDLYPDSTFFGNNTLTSNLLGLQVLKTDAAIVAAADAAKSAAGDVAADAGYVVAEVRKNIIKTILTDNKDHLSCGVIGISWLMRTLSEMGRDDVAWMLAGQTTYPSWGYMVEHGATTIWELWNGDTASPKMNSANHVMLLGDLISWIYKDIVGIKEMAGRHFTLAPSFGFEEINDIQGSLMTVYGRVAISFKKSADNNTVAIAAEVPANTTASLRMPDGSERQLTSGLHEITARLPLRQPSVSNTASVVCNEFLYFDASFPQCHSATMVETPKGDLVATYFGGTRERNADVCIYVSIKKKGAKEWSTPILAADGVFLPGTPDAQIAGVDTTCTLVKATAPEERVYTVNDFAINNYGLMKRRTTDKWLKGKMPAAANAAAAAPTPVPSPVPSSASTAKSGSLYRKACWNPVLHCDAKGVLTLYFKIGLKVSDWTGWKVTSRDGGRTWTDRVPLDGEDVIALRTDTTQAKAAYAPYASPFAKAQLLGPIKNKIVESRGRLIAPASIEEGGWRIYFELSDDGGRTWRKTEPLNSADTSIVLKAIQPAVIKLADGRLEALARTRNRRVAASFSSDNGETWSPVVLLDMPNNNSGLDAVTLSDGRHILICNDWPIEPTKEKGARTPLSLMQSTDGIHWQHVLTLEDSPVSQYSYPSIIQSADGHVHCIYTWRRQRIKHVEVKL